MTEKYIVIIPAYMPSVSMLDIVGGGKKRIS